MTNLEVSLRRIIVGYRLIAAVWLAVLAVITVRGAEAPERPGVVVATVVAVSLWTGLTLLISFRHPATLRTWWFITPDIAVAVGTLLAPDWAGSFNFYGGYPISSVLIAAYATGLAGGTAAVAVLTAVAFWRAVAGGVDEGITAATSAVLVYPFIAAPVIWGIGVLRRSDRLRRKAEVALEEERAERVRAEERSDLAAHLHDSVLQTLALIQRNSGDPVEVVTLARRQERGLREWLFGATAPAHPTFEAAILAMCGDVEEGFRFRVDPVVVGDTPMTDDLAAMVAATREAVINAAKHSQADSVSVYGEVDGGRVLLFVRDRGVGFDVDDVPADREGISTSIRDRMRRHGGQVEIRSTGNGTEVTLSMQL